jgi:hypothetical protein
MASKIKGQTMYLPITPYKVDGCEEEFNELSVTVNFDDRRKHFYVSVHAGWKSSWGGHGCIIMGDQDPLTAPQFFVVKESPKNSQKYLDQMYANLELAKEAIGFYFDKRKWLELRSLVIFVAACGYTENADKRVKADMAKENSSDNNQNNSEDKVMTNENVKVTDLIGKSISNGGNAKYTINAIEGDKVSVTFQMGDSEGKPMTMGVAQVEKLLQGGWTVQGSEEKKADGGSQKAEEPKAKTVKMTSEREQSGTRSGSAERESSRPQGKMEPEPKPKQEKPIEKKADGGSQKAEQPKGGRYRFSTYTRPTSDGGTKTLGRIDGLQEGDELLERGVAEKIHASPMYDRDGERKVWWLSFGKRYVEAGRKVCHALNEGRSLEDCQAIVDAQTDENHAQSEARRKKKAERKQKREAKTYTEAEVADLMRRVIAGDKEAMAIVNAMAA